MEWPRFQHRVPRSELARAICHENTKTRNQTCTFRAFVAWPSLWDVRLRVPAARRRTVVELPRPDQWRFDLSHLRLRQDGLTRRS